MIKKNKKNKNNQTKPRNQCLYLGSSKPFNNIQVINGEIVIPEEMNGLDWLGFYTTEYDREIKSPKMEVVIYPKNGRINDDPHGMFLKYDNVYFIDTNTNHDGLSATTCFRYKVGKVFESVRRYQDKPEIRGWIAVIELLNITNSLIFVDSELGNLQKYNARKIPLIDDALLSGNNDLAYASSDVGTFVANIKMKKCDENNRRLIKLAQQGGDALECFAPDGL